MFRLLSLLVAVGLMALLWLMVMDATMPSGDRCTDSSTTTVVSVPKSLERLVNRCP